MQKIKCFISFFVVLVFLASCQSHSDNGKSGVNLVDSSSITSNAQNDTPPDTVKIDSYPSDTVFITKVLTTGQFHGDEVWLQADTESWHGLFKDKAGYYIAKAKIKSEHAYDPIVDDDSSLSTGWNVQASDTNSCLILFTDLIGISDSRIQCLLKPDTTIMLGDTVFVNHKPDRYLIYATGTKTRDRFTKGEDWYWNYRLYITVIKNGKSVTELLVAQSEYSQYLPAISFMGDMDGDGTPDLIINFPEEDGNTITLYLSRYAKDGKLYRYAGRHSVVGC